ncbi:GntR family transcriptional regulator [Halanaerobium hydrogeniformans]|uniref:Transcriptional regulator, GntR family n=1 Tax=Halanaerobium hydrogeniformans TaxID=656519 RepID=E4RPY0_HALHG|nr:GntR family transcriptional regulator [Halanaerobium hydrogeniformans]ADQ14347.1 transcriptional regulator, GntR family [Halanaerobium hydrogeniformans]
MNLIELKNKDNLSMKNYVYKILKKNILELRLKPGTNLRKEEIAETLQVSRTPIREAFLKLAEEALIDVYPQRGTYVSYIALDNVEEAKFMRQTLETAIVKLACDLLTEDDLFKLRTNIRLQEMTSAQSDYINFFRHDNNFHRILFDACHKSNIWNAMDQMSNHLNRFRILSLQEKFNSKALIEEHRSIYKALEKRDSLKVENVMKEHIERVRIDANILKREHPEYFK